MSDEVQTPEPGNNILRNLAIGVVGAYIIFSLFFTYKMSERIQALETKQTASEEQLNHKILQTQSKLQSASENFDEKVGATQKDIAQRAAELRRQQQASESRLSEEQKKQQEALGSVTGEIAGVKGDVGGVKSDVSATKTDLEATKAKLFSAIGDLNIHSGLIATTREELEILKHKGDRNYYEFTLYKGKSPTPVSTVSLTLKKADKKKNRYTLNVLADDKTIEKKDKTANEPLQFYTGKDRMLYELVVFNVDKDKVTGYVSTPKNAAVAVAK
jgi:hypothetical protein